MKRLNILRFFSKKGVFWIGAFLMCYFLTVKAHAEYMNSYSPKGVSMQLFTYVDTNGHSHIMYADFVNETDGENIRIAYLNARNHPITSNVEWLYYDSGFHERADGTYSYNVGDYVGTTSLSNISSYEYMSIPVFSDYSKFNAYLAGTLDISKCDNWDDIKGAFSGESVSGIDDSLPYFDKSVMQLNQNNSVTYQSSMSAGMQTDFYEMCAKMPDKEDTGKETEHYRAYVEMTATALYADSKALGVFNSAALQLAGNAVNKDKLDDVIQFGSDGRIKVSSYVGHSGGGGRRSLADSMFHEESNAPLIAVEVDSIALSDKNSSFPGVVRNLSAKSNLIDMSLESYSPLFGAVVDYANYVLVGYVADVRIIYYDVSAGTYTASRDTYTYTWVYTTLQDRYGSGTLGYDSEGNIVSKNEFDNLNSDVGGSWGTLPDYEESTGNVLSNIKNGFGLLENNGLLALSQRTFTAIPLWIWVLVGMLISVNIIVIGLKIARGM